MAVLEGLATAELLDLEGKIIALSRPGYRQSSLANGRSLSEQANIVCQLLDQLGIPSAYVLAISGGGLAALQFALNHPNRCAGLILFSLTANVDHPLWPARLRQVSDEAVWRERLAQCAR